MERRVPDESNGTLQTLIVADVLRFPTVPRLEILGSWVRQLSYTVTDLECKSIAMCMVLEYQCGEKAHRTHYQQGAFATCA